MTIEQKETIAKLRSEGKSFTAIAEIINLPRETVKSFCRRNDVKSVTKEDRRHCPHCGGPVQQKMHVKRRRFCSDKCRKLWWNAHPEKINRRAVYDFTCAECGRPFTAYGDKNRKYCSHVCYINARFKGSAGCCKGAV